MPEPKYPSRLLDRFMLRMPDGMREKLADAAKANKRSVNAEVVARLEASLRSSLPASATEADTLHVLLDTDGMPISWHEIWEHISALQRAGKMNPANIHAQVVTSEMVSNSERAKEVADLAKRYRALLKQKRNLRP